MFLDAYIVKFDCMSGVYNFIRDSLIPFERFPFYWSKMVDEIRKVSFLHFY